MLHRNLELKEAKKSIPDWAIAEKLGISENTFYRWMRKELPLYKKQLVMQVIDDLKNELFTQTEER
jgi:phage antirepressor YoqD-like protein